MLKLHQNHHAFTSHHCLINLRYSKKEAKKIMLEMADTLKTDKNLPSLQIHFDVDPQ